MNSLHGGKKELGDYLSFLSGGCSKDPLDLLRDAGVNIAYFSGDVAQWKIRWETSIDGSGTPYRVFTPYWRSLPGSTNVSSRFRRATTPILVLT